MACAPKKKSVTIIVVIKIHLISAIRLYLPKTNATCSVMRYTFVASYLIALACTLAGLRSQATVYTDSVGIERNLGEIFVLHEVSEGETLFAISQRYNVSMDDLRELNKKVNLKKLNIGDTLRIPLFPQLAKGKKTRHVVEEGETLFSISQEYRVEVDDVRTWNAIGDASIDIGQELIVYLDAAASDEVASMPDATKYELHTVKEGETLYAIARTYGVEVDELRKRNSLSNEAIQFGQTLIIKEKELAMTPPAMPDVEVVPTTRPPVRSRRPSRSKALEAERKRFEDIKEQESKALEDIEIMSEMGFASVIEGGGATKKYLALHRTAPVGAVLRVRNEMNEVSVFVRVIGKLPDTGVNDKINIRLTPAAYEKLGGINERFPVEISYLK